MSDQKTNAGNQDRLLADANDTSEAEYLRSQFSHLKHQQVPDAVKSHGPMRGYIEKHLNTLK